MSAQLRLVFLIILFFGGMRPLTAYSQNVAAPQNYIGTINNRYPIRMTLSCKGSVVSGRYRYMNKAIWLTLRGTLSKTGLVSLKEFDAKGNETGLFRGRWEGKTITGQWRKPDGSRNAPFLVREERPNFAGQWIWELTKDGQTYTFDLTLKQKGTHLTGSHAATSRNGARIDETQTPDGTRDSIKGTIKGNIANVTFASGYDEKAGGKARLTLEEDHLVWKILASHGEHYFPQSATLKRKGMGKTPD